MARSIHLDDDAFVARGLADDQLDEANNVSHSKISAQFYTIAPIVALIYAVLLLPPEIQLSIAGLKITGYRVVIIGFAIFAILRLVRARSPISIGDTAVVLSSFWALLGFAAVYGLAEGLVRGSAVMLDALGAYLLARASIRSHDDLRRVLIVTAPVFALSAMILMIESVSLTLLFRPALAAIFGPVSVYSGGEAAGQLFYMQDTRLGLMRAYSGFSHPILAGVTLASILPLYFLSGLRSWPLWLGLAAGVLCIFSVSSAAFLCVAVGVALLIVDRSKGLFRLITWPSLIAGSIAGLTVFHFLTDNGIFRYLIRFTFSPHNGQVRLLQWDAGIAAMNENPWFGLGYEPIEIASWLPGSLDAHFLAIGVRSGWIVPVLLVIACIAIMVALGLSISRHHPRERDLIVGLNMSIGLLAIASSTVAFFAETNIYFMAVLGLGAGLAAVPSQSPFAWNRTLTNRA